MLSMNGVVYMQPEYDNIYPTDITEEERQTLNLILSDYDLEPILIERIRSAYKVYTAQGAFCLKKIGRGHKRAIKGLFVTQRLKKNGFMNVPFFYPTKQNTFFVRHQRSTFYLTHWIDGRELSFNSIDDILKAAELLANFHLAAKGLQPGKEIKIRNHYHNWEKNFRYCYEQINQFKRKIKALKKKTDFDELYYNNAVNLSDDAKLALKLISGDANKKVCKAAVNEKYICHDSFYYQNILVDEDNQLHIIDLESCIQGIPVSDLGKFIRRILTRSKYLWDFDLCRKIIDSYNNARQLIREEYYVLLAMIIFPHKFWKLGRKRYIKKKNWTEEKFNKKLKNLIILNDYKKDFIDTYIRFYKLHIDNNGRGNRI